MNHLQLAKKNMAKTDKPVCTRQMVSKLWQCTWPIGLEGLKPRPTMGSRLVLSLRFFPPDSLPNHWIGCTEELPMANQRNTRGSPGHTCQDAVMAASSVQVVIRVIEHVGEAPLLTLISYIFIKRRILQQ